MGPLYHLDDRADVIPMQCVFDEWGIFLVEGSGPVGVSSNDTSGGEASGKTTEDCPANPPPPSQTILLRELEDDDSTGEDSAVISSRPTRTSSGPTSAPRTTRSACVPAPQKCEAGSSLAHSSSAGGKPEAPGSPPSVGGRVAPTVMGAEKKNIMIDLEEEGGRPEEDPPGCQGVSPRRGRKEEGAELVSFPDVELRLHASLCSLCRVGFDEPLATPERGFIALKTELAVMLENIVVQVDKIVDSKCRDLFFEAATRVFTHLHLREPGFDFTSVILPVPTEARHCAAEAVKGPAEALVKRFAHVAPASSPDAAEAGDGEDDTSDADDKPPKDGATGGGSSS
ncbi:hypothetical protein ZWY2020_051972 [Hordeum vulgare]|nr:hypothetical protein ZWY2020_051972 [Hordeum vulgare]